jgi:hypothetical protein
LGQQRRVAGLRLFSSWAALPPLVVPLTGLLLQRGHLHRLSVVWLWVLSQLLVKDGQLFVELALASASLSSRAHRWVSMVQ